MAVWGSWFYTGNNQVHNRMLSDKHISGKWRSQTYRNSGYPICAAPFTLQLWTNSALNNLAMMKFYCTGLNLLSSVTGAAPNSLIHLNKRNFFCHQTLHFNFQFETTIVNYIVKNHQSWKIMELENFVTYYNKRAAEEKLFILTVYCIVSLNFFPNFLFNWVFCQEILYENCFSLYLVNERL